MTIFYASISIVAAAILGLVAGAYVGFRIASWISRRGLETMFKSESARTPMAVAWAYSQILKLINDGAGVPKIRSFINEEAERLVQVGRDIGERELGPVLVEDAKDYLGRDGQGDDR